MQSLERDIFALQEKVFPPTSYIIPHKEEMLVNIDWQKSEVKKIQSPGLAKLTGSGGHAWAETQSHRLFVTGGMRSEGVMVELVK